MIEIRRNLSWTYYHRYYDKLSSNYTEEIEKVSSSPLNLDLDVRRDLKGIKTAKDQQV